MTTDRENDTRVLAKTNASLSIPSKEGSILSTNYARLPPPSVFPRPLRALLEIPILNLRSEQTNRS